MRLIFKRGLFSRNIFSILNLQPLFKSCSYSRASIIGAGTVFPFSNSLIRFIRVFSFFEDFLTLWKSSPEIYRGFTINRKEVHNCLKPQNEEILILTQRRALSSRQMSWRLRFNYSLSSEKRLVSKKCTKTNCSRQSFRMHIALPCTSTIRLHTVDGNLSLPLTILL